MLSRSVEAPRSWRRWPSRSFLSLFARSVIISRRSEARGDLLRISLQELERASNCLLETFFRTLRERFVSSTRVEHRSPGVIVEAYRCKQMSNIVSLRKLHGALERFVSSRCFPKKKELDRTTCALIQFEDRFARHHFRHSNLFSF